ncbi:MAG: N-acetylmuramoyl-L-alanine amidase [Planctomycetes bacterium]|nr:N-acetylmuramoyl-L-alanine amidase [Planctomycetota bacterium]
MPAKHWHKLVAMALCLLLTDCAQKTQLVKDVPLPPFGSTKRPVPTSARQPAKPQPSARNTLDDSEWVPPVSEEKWRYIIVHHSATRQGDAELFDRMHRERGWDELGYHFVIGNGTLSGNGQVEIGSRWEKQKYGAHCKVRNHPEYNRIGIGICLVGNFNEGKPSEAQMESLAQLTRWLMYRYKIPKSRVLGHGMLKATDCPGKKFDYNDLYRRL